MILPQELRLELGGRDATAFPIGIGLSLTGDIVVEPILSLIPFISIGITGFAAFTISFIISRTSIVPLFLYMAVLSAFIGSLLDLVQLLLRGSQSVQLGLDLDSFAGFLDAREIFFALSFGFRLIFFWAVVAEGFGTHAGEDTNDIASWDRWGFVGMALKFLTLASCFAVPALQVVWRLGGIDNPPFTLVYAAEATMNIILPILFILKIFLTLFLCPSHLRIMAIRHYSLPTASLTISSGLGVGNLVSMTLSESTLGRFLQAIVMYLMLIFVLVVAFKAKGKPRPRSSFQALGLSALFNRPPSEKPRQPQPIPLTPPLAQSSPVNVTREKTSSPRPLSFERRSSLTSPRPAPRIPNFGGLPSRPNAAFSRLPDDSPGIIDITRDVGPPPPGPPPLPASALPLIPSLQISPVVNAPDSPNNTRNEVRASQSSLTSKGVRRYSDLPALGRLGRDSVSSVLALPADKQDSYQQVSPVYGLEGIIRQLPPPTKTNRSSVRSRASRSSYPASLPGPRASTASFEQLLKEQQALDNSIRLLKLFSPQDTAFSLSPYSESAIQRYREGGPSGVRSPTLSPSVSGRSDNISLSSFPDPPETAKSPEFRNRQVAAPESPRSFYDEQFSPPRGPVSQETPAESLHERLDSDSSQYEITSFIDGLATPRPPIPSSDNPEAQQNQRLSSLRPLLLSPSSSRPVQSVPYMGRPEPLKPFLLGTSGIRKVNESRQSGSPAL